MQFFAGAALACVTLAFMRHLGADPALLVLAVIVGVGGVICGDA